MTELDAAFARFKGVDLEYGGGLSNHGPMAAEALVTLGHLALVPAWIDRYAPRLLPLAAGVAIPPAQHSAATVCLQARPTGGFGSHTLFGRSSRTTRKYVDESWPSAWRPGPVATRHFPASPAAEVKAWLLATRSGGFRCCPRAIAAPVCSSTPRWRWMISPPSRRRLD